MLQPSTSVTAPVPDSTQPTYMSDPAITPELGFRPTLTQPVTFATSVNVIELALTVHATESTPSGDV